MIEEKVITVGEVENLLKDYDIEVESPDGFVEIGDYVDKGEWEEYVIEDMKGNMVRCNKNHMFETINGWVRCQHLNNGDIILKDDGKYHLIKVYKTGKMIPIVDIIVNHENHRYYSNGFSSHNTNVGKSALMCFLAGELVKQGKNVLYVSAEMSEEALYERIDANLLDVTTDQLNDPNLDKEWFLGSLKKLKKRGAGQYIAKEYPTSSAHAGHIKHLLKELAQKKKFKPDIIFMDYINIFTSSRYKTLNGVNSYSYIKAIAEEMRGLAVEENLPIVTASQLNREGSNSSQPDMTNTSESFGLPATADWMAAMVTNENLMELNQQLLIQLKTRYGAKKQSTKSQLVEVEFEKMRYKDLAQNVMEDKPVEDVKKTKAKFEKTKLDDWDIE